VIPTIDTSERAVLSGEREHDRHPNAFARQCAIGTKELEKRTPFATSTAASSKTNGG
jgi:hypothetical protein